jgi:aspartate aminotransferase
MPEIVDRVGVLRESPTRRIDRVREELRRRGIDLIMLSTGQPGVPPPRWLREKLAQLLLDESLRLYSYTPSTGLAELREAIAEDVRLLGGPSISADQVAVTAGGQSAMWAVMASILRPGDEVVLVDPTFFAYPPIIEYHGGRITWVRARLENGFQPDPEEFKKVVKRGKTRAVVLVTPDNPTGRVLDKSVAKAIVEYAADAGMWVIVDEAYKTLVYEGSHVWIYEYAPDNVVAINTFSKDPGLAGWRLGYVYGPPEAVKAVNRVVEHTVYCPPSIAQYAVLVYLRERRLRMEFIEYVRSIYARRRDYMVKVVEELLPEARFAKPQGAMFLLLDLSSYISRLRVSSEELAEVLLRKKHVATVPGSYFGSTTRYALRLSFVSESEERIGVGVKRLAELLAELGGGVK